MDSVTSKSSKIFTSYNLHLILVGLAVLCFILAFSPESQTNIDSYQDNKEEVVESSDENKPNTIETQNNNLANEWQTITVQQGENLSNIFTKLGVPNSTLHNLLDKIEKSHSYDLNSLKPGQKLQYQLHPSGELKKLALNLSLTEALHIHHHPPKNFEFNTITKKIEHKITYGGNIIQESLALAGQKAGLSDKTILELANIFGWDIDFALDVRENDSFRVLYEEKYIDGKKVATGNILAAEFVNQGRVYQAIKYKTESGKIEYYSPEGYSMRQAFSRTPVNFTRISSHFNLRRRHPVLHKIRAHRGVDYAAPIGTPVKATGNAKISFIGQKGGYGNVIILDHGRGYTTLYAHLSRFRAGLRKGSAVKQGEIIAFVGKSGLASGPHLHYEFRINGVHRNPLTVELPKNNTIPEHKKAEFNQHARKMLKLLTSPHLYPTLSLEQLESIEIF